MIRIFALPIIVDESCIDIMQHTNNKVYLKWMEQAALAHSDALGWTMKRYFEVGGAFIAKRHWIQYLRPTHLGDELVLYTWVEGLEGKTSLRRFVLMRDKKICMKGATEWAFVDVKTGRSTEIFPFVAEAFPIVSRDDPELLEKGIKVNPIDMGSL